MKIKRLVIENFKSIERIELIEPNPFTVFVGPNGSGKSNIFEALEFHISNDDITTKLRLFGGKADLQNRQRESDTYSCIINSDRFYKQRNGSFATVEALDIDLAMINDIQFSPAGRTPEENESNYRLFANNSSRIFVRNDSIQKRNYKSDSRLSLSCNNLERVLKRVLTQSVLRDEIFEWLELFVPSFKAVEIDDRNELHWFEEFSLKYFNKDLISAGTYNILALLTAVYQSDDKPQFLCIEEPENGLHPQVAGELIDFFRIMCEERGHYIWLNTHSQSMASRVRPNEFVVVEKKEGATTIRQFKNEDFSGMRVDEAWLTNALNGGLAW